MAGSRLYAAFTALAWGWVLAAAEIENGLVLWDRSVNIRGALGYKDNVLLSNVQREGSAFWLSAFDLFLVRADVREGAGSFSFFVSAEDRRYFSVPDLDKEQFLLAHAKFEKPFLEEWKAGVVAQYLYVDQVFDASDTETLLRTLPVKGHNVQLIPAVSRKLPAGMNLELKFTPERQFFEEPLDDYWEYGPTLILTKKYGYKSELGASYTYDHRVYDRRLQFALDARAIPDTSLTFNQHEFELSVNHSWDKARHWRSRGRFVFELNSDNGTGYYDYRRYRWSKRIGYYGSDWEITVEGKVQHYDYLLQPVFDGTEIRDLWDYAATIHAEKTIWKKLKIFVEGEYDAVNSNYRFEEYYANTVFAGVDWEF